MATRLEDMTEAQKQEAYQKWLTSKTERKAKGSAKRQATKALIDAHKDEFQKLIKQYEGKPAAKAK